MRQRTSFLFCAAVLAAVPSALAAQDVPKPRVVGPPTAVVVGGPTLGGAAPQFSLPWATRDTTSDDSFSYNLTRDRGKVVVLTFYTQDFTPSATVQLQRIRDRAAEWGEGVVVLGASIDPPARHRRFASSLDLPFRLLSDADQEVARAYGVRGSNGQPRRSVFVIGADGALKYSDTRFDPANAASYAKLDAAVAAARQ
jgi:thioredoxin-dependent peroxiredoxin